MYMELIKQKHDPTFENIKKGSKKNNKKLLNMDQYLLQWPTVLYVLGIVLHCNGCDGAGMYILFEYDMYE